MYSEDSGEPDQTHVDNIIRRCLCAFEPGWQAEQAGWKACDALGVVQGFQRLEAPHDIPAAGAQAWSSSATQTSMTRSKLRRPVPHRVLFALVRASATRALLCMQASFEYWFQGGLKRRFQLHQHAGAASLVVHLSCELADVNGAGLASSAVCQLFRQCACAAIALSAPLCARRCGHCKALKPAFQDLAARVAGKARVAAVDCTESAATCQVTPQCRRTCASFLSLLPAHLRV